MSRIIKARSKKSGMPAGSLVHIGEKFLETVKFKVILYSETSFEEKELDTIEACLSYKDKPGILWINVDSVHEPDVIQKIGSVFQLHPLTCEDVLNTDQRPKVEDFEKYIYAVFKQLFCQSGVKYGIHIEQVSLILTSNTVISFQEGIKGDVFNSVREALRKNKGLIRKMGSDYLAYSLLDAVVDNYFNVLEDIEGKIEILEAELLSFETSQALKNLYHLKREMMTLRKAVWPLREVVNALSHDGISLISKTTQTYFRDVYDHAIQVIEVAEVFREMMSELLEIYLSSINNRLNSIMKVLTAVATVFTPPMLIASIYGMNFKYIPGLESKWGYPLALGSMFVIGFGLLFFFKKRKWL